jgi:8-oxo-dGTP pyrophosphatase MutT (NUDIX family)
MDVVFQVEQNVFNYRVVGILIENGHVLIHRSKMETHWSLPGGRIKYGEDAKSSLKREMMEELAVQVESAEYLWTVENFFTYKEKEFHEVGLYFKIKTIKPLLFQNGEEFTVEEAERLVFKWVPLEDLKVYPLYPTVVKDKLLNGSFVPGYLLGNDKQTV